MNTPHSNLSDFEKILLGIAPPEKNSAVIPLRQGDPCPRCGESALDYNAMLQLACAACGFVNGEAGGCT